MLLPLMDNLGSHQIVESLPSFTLAEAVQNTELSLASDKSFNVKNPATTTWVNIAFIIYLSVTGTLLLRLLIGFIKALRIKKQSFTKRIDNTVVHFHQRVHEPMTIFNNIYMPLDWHTNVPKYVINHEKAHVQQLHAFDLLLGEIASVIFWFNPIVYFIKNAQRLNLEYLADQAVLEQSRDKLKYQSALLSHVIGKGDSKLLSLNFSDPLKNRIEMMNKRKSSKWLKALLFGCVPIALLLLAMTNRTEATKPITASVQPFIEKFAEKPSAMPLNESDIIKISSGFGNQMHPTLKVKKFHTGIDLVAKPGTPIFATADGEVVIATSDEDRGNYVQLKHSEIYQTQYAHMSRFVVVAGESIKKGQIIGYVGNSGKSTGPHLHYEIHKNGIAINPSLEGC
ncbi:M23/M56 family metallopeptidase [Fulvivirga aurantia]|uniref:M23/M56 family metallopeptidase n=1 Tax=Fulvivirga aurantia TaxID=2529383 RepID=UPI001628179C|nr:M23/M56 family metallopeptidase [Fulvivirga aurantia]